MMRSFSTEVKVGLFGLAAFAVLLYMTVLVGNFSFLEKEGKLVYAYFDNVAGLDKKSVVRVAGVGAGKVEDITLENRKAKVTIKLDEGIRLSEDAVVYIRTESLLGERYLEIDPGSPDKPELPSGSIIKVGTGGTAGIDRLMEKFDSMAEDISAVVKPLKEILAEEGAGDIKGFLKDFSLAVRNLNETIFSDKDRLDRIITNFDVMSKDLRSFGEKLDKGEGSLGKLVKDDTLYNEAKKTLTQLNHAVESLNNTVFSDQKRLERIVNNIDSMSTNFMDLSKKLEKGEGSLGKLLQDDTLYNEAKKTLTQLGSAVESLNKTLFSDQNRLDRIVNNFDTMSKNFSSLSDRLEKGEGSLGKLLKDDTLYDDAKKTMADLRESIPKLRESINSFHDISQKIARGEGTIGKLLNDETLYTETKQTVSNINTITSSIIRGEGTLGKLYKDDTLYIETKNTMQKLGRAAEGMEDQVPISVLGSILGFLF